MRPFRSIKEICRRADFKGVERGEVTMMLMKCGNSVQLFNVWLSEIEREPSKQHKRAKSVELFGQAGQEAVRLILH